jgi:hypothetical protein
VDEDGNKVITFQPWVPWLVGLLGVAAIPAGIVLLTRKQFFGRQRFCAVCLIVVGPLLAGILAPQIYFDRVTIGRQGLYYQHGPWWNPTIQQIRYDDLALVRIGFERRFTRRGTEYSYHLDCLFKFGKQERIPLGDLLKEAWPDLLEQLLEHGVPVEIPPDLPEW